jgi:hypothetical protein
MKHFWKSGLKVQIWEKLESIGAIERPRQGSGAPMFAHIRK